MVLKPEIAMERASIVSSTADPLELNKEGKYVEARTPDEIEGGALRPGGAPDLLSKDSIGLLAQYAAVGLIYGSFPSTVYPFLSFYLKMDSYQVKAAETLVLLPWSLKTFIGIVSDAFPIRGYRRRPYMVFGWGMCLFFLIVMGCLPVSDPFYLRPSDLGKDPEKVPSIWLNEDAPGSGAKYIMLMMMAALGYLIADVAADGMVVEFAQREPDNIRGTTQSMIYFVRTCFAIIARLFIGTTMNGKEYGGQFDFSLKFNQVAKPNDFCRRYVQR